MKAFSLKSITLDRLINLFWGLVLLCLPVTTFNFFPSFFFSSQTRPMALYPLAILLPLLLYRQIRERDFRFPTVLIPLLAFLAAAFVSTVLGIQYITVDVHGQSFIMRSIKGWLSAAIGLSFFYAAFMSVRSRADLERTLRWLFAGFLLGAFVGVIQTIAIQTSFLKFAKVHNFLSNFIRQTSHGKRVSGLAFEPSWYADQLIMLYLPWLLSAVLFDLKLTGRRVLDWVLLLLLGALLMFTYSRAGLLNAVMSVGLAAVFTLPLWWRSFFSRVKAFFTNGSPTILWAKRIGLVLVCLAIVAGVVFAMSSYGYVLRLFDFSGSETLTDYIINISFGPRAGYAVAAFEVYEDYPLMGVGWGSSGMHMYDHFPDWLKTFSKEMEHFFDPAYKVIPNPKNMYVRLLSETGLVGFWLFAGFLLSILGQVVRFFQKKDSFNISVGFAALLLWLVVVIRYLTMDSFASPIPWIGLGIIIGLAHNTLSNTSEEVSIE